MPASHQTRWILEHSFRKRAKLIDAYCEEHKVEYQRMAEAITPRYAEWGQIWSRVAFAILSANAPFDRAVKTLQYVTTCKGHADPFVIVAAGHVPGKAEWINNLPCGAECLTLLKDTTETWDVYRTRLQKTIKGLAQAKASFAAALLYPTVADVACIDTHMQKVYLDYTAFKRLPRGLYLSIEAKVRCVGQRHQVSTFLAQWLIWDCTRGSVTPHNVFPGSHKL